MNFCYSCNNYYGVAVCPTCPRETESHHYTPTSQRGDSKLYSTPRSRTPEKYVAQSSTEIVQNRSEHTVQLQKALLDELRYLRQSLTACEYDISKLNTECQRAQADKNHMASKYEMNSRELEQSREKIANYEVLKMELEQIKDRNSLLKSDLDSSKHMYQVKDSEHAMVIRSLEESKRQMESELLGAKENHKALFAAYQTACKEKESLAIKNSEIMANLSAVRTLINAKDVEINSFQSRIQTLESITDATAKECDVLTSKMQDIAKERLKLSGEMEAMKSAVKTAQSERMSATAEREEILHKHERLQLQFDSVQSQLRDSRFENLKTQESIELLKRQLVEERNVSAGYITERDHVKELYQETRKHLVSAEAESAKLKFEVDNFKIQLETWILKYNTEVKTYKDSIEDLHQQMNHVQEESDSWRQKCEAKHEENERVKRDIASLKVRLESMQQSLESLRDENETLENSLSKNVQMLQEVTHDKGVLENKYEETQARLAETMERMALLKSEMSKLEFSYQQSELQREELTAINQRLNSKIETLQKACERATAEVVEVRKELESALDSMEELKDQLTENSLKLKHAHDENVKLKHDLVRSQEEYVALQHSYEELEALNKQIEEEKERTVKKLDAKIAQLSKEKQSFSDRLVLIEGDLEKHVEHEHELELEKDHLQHDLQSHIKHESELENEKRKIAK
eukprot:PhF_6_TR42939/c0_g1_i1/m.65217